jgi:uncharacterized protein YqcC (DUF446 family)
MIAEGKVMNTILLEKLDQVEAEMRRIGYWQEAVPPEWQEKVDAGQVRSYLEAPTFELWLQTVFLPHAREASRTGNLPSDSSVGVMAMRQYDYHSSIPEAHDLMRLLFEFDELVRKKG